MSDQDSSNDGDTPATDYPVPAPITGLLADDELSNLRARTGWAVGAVTIVSPDGRETLDPAFIELLNGAGHARNMGGVRYLATDSARQLREGYAYPSPEPVESGDSYAVVTEYHDPADPDWGTPVPPR